MGSSKRASRSKMVIPVLFALATLGLVKAELKHNETDQRELPTLLSTMIPGSDWSDLGDIRSVMFQW
jgi:hypothetical protein